jgi:CheY-like chemotaxis protein
MITERFWETVSRLLAADFDVVGAVENGEQPVQAVASLDPDVVVLDIAMPVMRTTAQCAARARRSSLVRESLLAFSRPPRPWR